MKLVSSLTLIFAFLCLLACNKSGDPIPKEEIGSQLPKQVFITFEYDAPFLYSIKYDTTNYLIDVYYDDTTNTNPYDVLAKRFQFNNGGYLVSMTANLEDGSFDEKKTIHRGADNKIQWIAGELAFNESRDTTWFTYKTVEYGTEISTIKNTYFGAESIPTYSDTFFYKYNTANKIIDNGRKGSSYGIRTYNANGSLSAITDPTNTGTFYYNSGLPDGTSDIVMNVFLGKDYYLQNLQDLYPFNLFYEDDYFSLSSTDPFHITRFEENYIEDGQHLTDFRNYQYEVDQNRISRIIINTRDSGTGGMIFKY